MEKGRFGRVGQFVVNFFAEAAGADETGLFEQAEMVRYGGCAHVDRNGDVIDAFFAMTQKEQDFQAGGVADKLKNRGNLFNGAVVRQGTDYLFVLGVVAMQPGIGHIRFLLHLQSSIV